MTGLRPFFRVNYQRPFPCLLLPLGRTRAGLEGRYKVGHPRAADEALPEGPYLVVVLNHRNRFGYVYCHDRGLPHRTTRVRNIPGFHHSSHLHGSMWNDPGCY